MSIDIKKLKPLIPVFLGFSLLIISFCVVTSAPFMKWEEKKFHEKYKDLRREQNFNHEVWKKRNEHGDIFFNNFYYLPGNYHIEGPDLYENLAYGDIIIRNSNDDNLYIVKKTKDTIIIPSYFDSIHWDKKK